MTSNKKPRVTTDGLPLESEEESTEAATDQIAQLQEQIQQLDGNWKRALADYQNLLRQTQRERQEYVRYANENLVTRFLPVLDNLELAYQHLKDPGLDMVVKQFRQIFTDLGLDRIQPQPGDPFNEQLHECIETIPSSDQPANTISKLNQIGYKWNEGPILRHAKVSVFSPVTSPEEKNS